jgi:ABC-type sugar transport system substrate-binding protein
MSEGDIMTFDFARGRLLATVCACVGALALSACGSSGSSSSSGGGSSNAAATNSASATFPAAAAANAKFMQRPTSIGITTPVGKPIPKGKVLDFIQCGVPACVVEGNLLQNAAQLLGWQLKRINAGTTPEQIANAYQQAVNNKPDAVLGSGYPSVLFSKELKALAAQHIPVVEAFNEDTAGNGITGLVGTRVTTLIQGKELADYILANSTDKSMAVGSVVPTGFPTMVVTYQSLAATIKQNCSSCSVKKLDVPVTSIGSDLPSRIASFLTANPDIKWTQVGYDDMAVGVPTALKGAGNADAKLVTVSLNGAIAPYIKQKNFLQAAVGTSFPEAYWREIDLLARYFTKQPFDVDTNDATLPYWTITAQNMPSNAGSETFANVVDYEQQYKKLWGLS